MRNGIKRYFVNEEIKASNIRLIDENGKQLGILSEIEALKEAESRGMDLILVYSDATPPVCKIGKIKSNTGTVDSYKSQSM